MTMLIKLVTVTKMLDSPSFLALLMLVFNGENRILGTPPQRIWAGNKMLFIASDTLVPYGSYQTPSK